MRGSKISRDLLKFSRTELDVRGYKSETPGQNGEPDLKFLFRQGRWIYIEVKGDGDTLSVPQKIRISDYRKLGQICYVIKELQEGKDILRWHKKYQRPFPRYSRTNEK